MKTATATTKTTTTVADIWSRWFVVDCCLCRIDWSTYLINWLTGLSKELEGEDNVDDE